MRHGHLLFQRESRHDVWWTGFYTYQRHIYIVKLFNNKLYRLSKI